MPRRTPLTWAAFIAFHAVSALGMVALLATSPDPSGVVALIYPPGLSAADAFQRAASAGARPIRHGNADWIIVAAPEPDDAGFSSKAYAGGALAILNPVVVGACTEGSPPTLLSTSRR